MGFRCLKAATRAPRVASQGQVDQFKALVLSGRHYHFGEEPPHTVVINERTKETLLRMAITTEKSKIETALCATFCGGFMLR